VVCVKRQVASECLTLTAIPFNERVFCSGIGASRPVFVAFSTTATWQLALRR
jgi:hypothetical protein